MNHAEEAVALLKEKGWHVSFAESCTAGLAAGALVSVPSASAVLDASFITYANEAKVKYCGVRPETLAALTKEWTEVSLLTIRKRREMFQTMNDIPGEWKVTPGSMFENSPYLYKS